MKQVLYRHIILCYFLTGLLGFLIIVGGGSYLVEKRLEQQISEKLYDVASRIAADKELVNQISTSKSYAIQKLFYTMSHYQDVEMWIMNTDNQIIVSSEETISSDAPVVIPQFDPTQWGDHYYQIGKFFDYFSTPHISVMASITSDMNTIGYVIIHYDCNKLYQRRSNLLEIMVLLYAVIYLLFGVPVLIFRNFVHKPLMQIATGATEYANGNLTYDIPVHSSNEIGYLANALNYMADKLNENGEYQRNFISNVSHDFRSPLTSIKGYVGAMLDGTIPPEMQKKYLSIISYEVERLEKLTNNLLDLNNLDSKKRRLHLRRFDINEVLKSTATVFEGICTNRRIRLELLLSGRELMVQADMEQIQQVVYNLLDNAIKFSNDNSSILIETTTKNEVVFVSVKDHGIGIPKESLPKIWDRFYKTDVSRGKDRKGTGLGLCIVKEIINAHAQNINVISTEGVGSEFIFSLEKAK